MANAASKPIATSAATSSSAAASSSSTAGTSLLSYAPAGHIGFSTGEVSATLRAPAGGFRAAVGSGRMGSIEKLVLDLVEEDRRESALAQLSRQVICQDLAPMLWFSFGTITVLLKEILSVYPLLSPPTLTLAQSNRICNVLALLQCVASHPDTRNVLVRACIPLYLYSFIKTTCGTKQFEYLRLNSLGVIGALVKVPDTQVILFLLSNEFMPVCLCAMECGSELSKTVAAFIMQRIMLDDVGLEYVCSTPERLFAVNRSLANVVAGLVEQPSARLLKHVIRCYLRFSQHERGLWILRYSLPIRLADGTFHRYLWGDGTVRLWLQQLLENVQSPPNACGNQHVDEDALHRTVIGIC